MAFVTSAWYSTAIFGGPLSVLLAKLSRQEVATDISWIKY
jgi:hypothetical protein